MAHIYNIILVQYIIPVRVLHGKYWPRGRFVMVMLAMCYMSVENFPQAQ